MHYLRSWKLRAGNVAAFLQFLRRQKIAAGSVLLLFGVLGSVIMLSSHAVTSTLSLEAENGTLSDGASGIDDGGASGGKAVQFGSGSTGSQRMPELPFDIPSRADLAASPREVLAYYHSIPLYGAANTDSYGQNISPNGNGGAYYSSGGKWRQQPYPIIDTTNLDNTKRTRIMAEDISQAADIGIDGFLFNVYYLPSDPRWSQQLTPMYDGADQYNAGHTPGFHVAIDLDMHNISTKPNVADRDPIVLADDLAPFIQRSSYYHYKGRPAVSTYQVDAESPQWYRDFAAEIKSKTGQDIYILASFQGNDPTTALAPLVSAGLFPSLMPTIHQWALSSYTTSPGNIQSATRAWAAAHNTTYMGTEMVFENDRPTQQKEFEGDGFALLQNMWEASITAHQDSIFEIVSWNDHEEEHNIRPSTGYQWAPYDITAYFITWFKTGRQPPITRDTLFYAHRMQKVNATYDTTKQPLPYKFALSTIAVPQDKVITYAFLKAPADVTVISGGKSYVHSNVPAGATILNDVPLAVNDQPSFSASRNGTVIVPQFTSPFKTRSSVVWQDLLYRMGGSNRPVIDHVQTDLPENRL